jgi:hypothetical protein
MRVVATPERYTIVRANEALKLPSALSECACSLRSLALCYDSLAA